MSLYMFLINFFLRILQSFSDLSYEFSSYCAAQKYSLKLLLKWTQFWNVNIKKNRR